MFVPKKIEYYEIIAPANSDNLLGLILIKTPIDKKVGDKNEIIFCERLTIAKFAVGTSSRIHIGYRTK